jgi:hypothetical protein
VLLLEVLRADQQDTPTVTAGFRLSNHLADQELLLPLNSRTDPLGLIG